VITLDSFAPVPESLRGAYLAVGNFDGVHRGHARLIARLRERAVKVGAPAVALTFDPPPAQLLRPDSSPKPLSWTARKVALLKEAGADDVGVFRTGTWLLGLTAREFFDRVVIGQFGAKGMVEGPTFGFGRDRGGDATILGSWCESAGLGFEVVAPTEFDGKLISSSRIRAALDEGRVDEAADLLGRPYRMRGRVAKGAGRGATLGFPTANLAEINTMVPADGVYAVRVFLDGDALPKIGAAHIGPNATFGATSRSVEIHILDFEGDLYGRGLEVEFVRWLRGSRKFAGVEALLEQIRHDVERTREALAGPRLIK
jgi:riboflavin kinase/FMN adenylyltransferase